MFFPDSEIISLLLLSIFVFGCKLCLNFVPFFVELFLRVYPIDLSIEDNKNLRTLNFLGRDKYKNPRLDLFIEAFDFDLFELFFVIFDHRSIYGNTSEQSFGVLLRALTAPPKYTSFLILSRRDRFPWSRCFPSFSPPMLVFGDPQKLVFIFFCLLPVSTLLFLPSFFLPIPNFQYFDTSDF